MAKRTRYPKRPKTRPASRQVTRTEAESASASILRRPEVLDTPAGSDDALPLRSSSSLTEAEFEQAERLEAELLAKEREAIAESLRRKARTEEHALGGAGDLNAPLSVRAAHEYAYVARDVKRIALTAGLMFGILAVLYILTNVLGVIAL
jgi:hypothetical protein